MDLAPLTQASAPIPLHAFGAMGAFVLGVAQFVLAKGTLLHRAVGRLWVGLMVAVALSSFFIWELRMIGAFSPIHLLSLFTLFWLWRAVAAARRGDIAAHRRLMKILFVCALLGAGAFTFLPGRIMHDVLF
ncbi:DUF2306 domain-containing protein [Phaeobacter sp. QD34_3]|uniref:DUF2306 domain-containing protein n=1 Tax=unclassified Phaeobacter TaxID=2621772 RepID=UPI00237F78BD|nr:MULTISPECIES: DUF2306 domain-containing protein [unclassified Phaeobacter]MDE4131932.1 DUF2306 domain-containing protein [Phaeobacter sp. QD34_3]MDE4135570.1 DUF2306 domain-containing protein [Phaeobacter sp. QD34_24]MDE4173559.1 DUF2306 domain-containing protein [Phaeobacter sp. PT47_59]